MTKAKKTKTTTVSSAKTASAKAPERPVLGLTMGDPAGVGPELCLKALSAKESLSQCIPVLFGDAGVIQRLGKAGLKAPSCPVLSLAEWSKLEVVSEPMIVDCAAVDASKLEPGKVNAACGKAAFTYIETAIRAAMAGRIEGVVTAPINKEAINLAGVPHPGHTEIFTELAHAKRSCMMLRSQKLTVSMVTTHVGYSQVSQKLSVRRVLDVVELTAEAMGWMLRRTPRLGICGLNPHSGEHGLFGCQEEERFIQPAIEAARSEGISIEGPIPPDAAFTAGQLKRYDAIVTLYHDQGHIPFKMVAFDTGVNVTLGLPIIRTSVDHGTAFDIAWKGIASPTSLYCAIDVAVEMAAGRRQQARA
jgi:4-phospho-D-threonate 3-dehydrogenase / 4-phospho-D-erythronate 3-dehydrogenase